MERPCTSSKEEKRAVQAIISYVGQTSTADFAVPEGDSKKSSSEDPPCPLMHSGKRRRKEHKSSSLVTSYTSKIVRKHYHKIADEGCLAITGALAKNMDTKLRELNLSYNMVVDSPSPQQSHVELVIASIRCITRVGLASGRCFDKTPLCACKNSFFPGFTKAVMAAVARNATLQKLYFANNSTR
eukprot:516385-Amorphochlora_amoeboformis.AAC.1